MDLKALTAVVTEFSRERNWSQFHSPRNLAMALQVEASELLALYLWCDDDGERPLTQERETQLAGEAADVLHCLLNFCQRANVDLESAFLEKMKIADKKYPVDRVKGSALKYSEYKEWNR
jgi:dCTP diphosphatase